MVRGQLRGLRGAPARAARRGGRPPAPDHLQEAHARLTRVRFFTDPGSPAAFCAEPARLRLRWLLGEAIEWETRMAVVRREPGDDTRAEAAEMRRLARASGMPIDARVRRHVAPTVHACRAVVAVRLGWPEREDPFLRALSVLIMAGEPADDSDTLELAAARAGLPVAELAAFAGRAEVREALEADAALARGRPCPSYEVDGVAAPGLERLDAALAGAARRGDPASAGAVLDWAPYPLATVEVAAICGRDAAAVRAELARIARFEPVGADGYWSRG